MDSNTTEVLRHCITTFERATDDNSYRRNSTPTGARQTVAMYVRALHELREYLPSIGVDMLPLTAKNYGRQDFSKNPLPHSYEPIRRKNWQSDRVAWCHYFMLLITECLRDAVINEDLGVINPDLWCAATFIVNTHNLKYNSKALVPTRAQQEEWSRLERIEAKV